MLLERWEAAQAGRGQVVLLSGEAGIGKSRLVQLLQDHVAASNRTHIECRCSPYFTNSTLYPIIDMLHHVLQWHLYSTPEERLAQLEQALNRYRLPLAESVPLVATLLSLPVPEDRYPPLHVSPQQQRQKILQFILAIMLELAEQQPLLLILEDLHWTDPTTLELVALLIDQAPTTAIYVLLTCRPEFHPPWSHRSYLAEVTVNRLSSGEIEQFVGRLTHGKPLPEEMLQQIVEKTDGVPLFTEIPT